MVPARTGIAGHSLMSEAGRQGNALQQAMPGGGPAPADVNALAALFHAGRHADVEAGARLLLARHPGAGPVWNLLGASLLVQGKDSLQALQNATEFSPDDAFAQTNLGNALFALGRLDEAAASFRRALRIKPDHADAYYNLANALLGLGQRGEAVAGYRRALALQPDCAMTHNNLGTVLRDLGQLDAAQASFRRALAIEPGFAAAHNNLGAMLKDLGQFDAARRCFCRALAISPGFTQAYSNLLFGDNFLPGRCAAQSLAEARRYGDLVARQARPFTAWSNAPDPARCLRVGLVSGDLRAHAAGHFLEGVLAAMADQAAGRLEFFAYSNHAATDAVTQRIRSRCRGWLEISRLADAALATRLRDDGIDILLDLSGHTAHNRLPLFAWKPAPVQASWLGYFATTGVAAMDYLIADPWTLPVSEEAHFTEKIWRLPETRLCFTAPDADVPIAPLPALAGGHVTFGCFNNLAKINDAVVALWARVLAAVPGSRLFLKARQLDEAALRHGVVARFAARGVEAGRLILEGAEPRAHYLAAYRRVDIALDPFPFTGGATSAEALWMGVPVLTLAGQSFLSRQGIGLLMNAGLPEWIASDADDYVARAAAHAGDLRQLAALHGGLRQQALASPVFDAARFAGHFEAALRGMWVGWCDRGQARSCNAGGA